MRPLRCVLFLAALLVTGCGDDAAGSVTFSCGLEETCQTGTQYCLLVYRGDTVVYDACRDYAAEAHDCTAAQTEAAAGTPDCADNGTSCTDENGAVTIECVSSS